MGSAWGRQSSFNPMMEPSSLNPMHELPDVDDDWCNLASPEIKENQRVENILVAASNLHSYKQDADFSFPCTPVDEEDDEEVTESKIKAFLDEKALELKRLQTPLYMEFQSIWNIGGRHAEETNSIQSDRHKKGELASFIAAVKSVSEAQLTSRSSSKKSSRSGLSIACSRDSEATVSSESPRLNELKRLLLETQQPLRSPSTLNSSERQRLWKEELQQELEIFREERKLLSHLAGSTTRSSPAGKLSSRKEKVAQRPCAKSLVH